MEFEYPEAGLGTSKANLLSCIISETERIIADSEKAQRKQEEFKNIAIDLQRELDRD